VRPVGERHVDRQLDQLPSACLDHEGHAVTEQRRVVEETLLDEPGGRAARQRRVRDARAGRARAGEALDQLDAAVKLVQLLLGRELVRSLVEVAVVRDLVAARDHRLAHRRVAIDAPPADEERLADAEAVQDLDDPRQGDLVVAEPGQGGVELEAAVAAAVEHERVGIDVPAHAGGAPLAVRPRDAEGGNDCHVRVLRAQASSETAASRITPLKTAW
jgi:hypothetical protein